MKELTNEEKSEIREAWYTRQHADDSFEAVYRIVENLKTNAERATLDKVEEGLAQYSFSDWRENDIEGSYISDLIKSLKQVSKRIL